MSDSGIEGITGLTTNPQMMPSPVVEAYPASNLTQAQNGVNPHLQTLIYRGMPYDFRVRPFSRPVAIGIRLMILHIPPLIIGFIAHLCAGEDNTFLSFAFR
jgi:hypothetical protein